VAKRARRPRKQAPTPERVLECSFRIPSRRDAEVSDGNPHDAETWEWLGGRLYALFHGKTIAPGWYEGTWESPRTGQPVSDRSRKYIVAVPEKQVATLRQLLVEACGMFGQQMLYLSVAGVVEFIEAPGHGGTA